MSAIPLQVLTRPFAIEPVTNIMLPDGIFDNAIFNLRLAAHFTNTSSSALTNVTIYFESVGDPGIVPVARTHFFASIPAGAAVLVQWDANFEHASPGKRLVSFVAKGRRLHLAPLDPADLRVANALRQRHQHLYLHGRGRHADGLEHQRPPARQGMGPA